MRIPKIQSSREGESDSSRLISRSPDSCLHSSECLTCACIITSTQESVKSVQPVLQIIYCCAVKAQQGCTAHCMVNCVELMRGFTEGAVVE